MQSTVETGWEVKSDEKRDKMDGEVNRVTIMDQCAAPKRQGRSPVPFHPIPARPHSPRLDPRRIVPRRHTRLGELPRDHGREDVLWVLEVEEVGHVEVSREEVGVDKVSGGGHSLE